MFITETPKQDILCVVQYVINVSRACQVQQDNLSYCNTNVNVSTVDISAFVKCQSFSTFHVYCAIIKAITG